VKGSGFEPGDEEAVVTRGDIHVDRIGVFPERCDVERDADRLTRDVEPLQHRATAKRLVELIAAQWIAGDQTDEAVAARRDLLGPVASTGKRGSTAGGLPVLGNGGELDASVATLRLRERVPLAVDRQESLDPAVRLARRRVDVSKIVTEDAAAVIRRLVDRAARRPPAGKDAELGLDCSDVLRIDARHDVHSLMPRMPSPQARSVGVVGGRTDPVDEDEAISIRREREVRVAVDGRLDHLAAVARVSASAREHPHDADRCAGRTTHVASLSPWAYAVFDVKVRAVLALVVAACGPPPMLGPDNDAGGLPEGVYEPDPGPGRTEARVVVDGTDLWFAYTRAGATADISEDEVWLTKTSSAGEPLLAPRRVDTSGPPAGAPTVALSGDRVIVAFEHYVDEHGPRVRVLDRDGVPSVSTDREIPVEIGGDPIWRVNSLMAIGTGNGASRLLMAVEDPIVAVEMVQIDLDALGSPVGSMVTLGSDVDAGSTGTVAALRDDGSIVLAWTRIYGQEHLPAPSAVAFSTIDDLGTAGPVGSVPNTPDRSELNPAIASSGDTTYLAWAAETSAGFAIAMSRFADVGSVVAEFGTSDSYMPAIAMAGPGKGAVAWVSDERRLLAIASFDDDGDVVRTGPVHEIPTVAAATHDTFALLSDLVHVADGTYALIWSEQTANRDTEHLYATLVDLR
jgi:hypothetical protein